VPDFCIYDPSAEPESLVVLEQVALLEVLQPGMRVKMVGADRTYQRRGFVAASP
jgi:hypothetical protein